MIAGETFTTGEEATNGFRFTHWPTEYPVITQIYNNNPAYYGQWGLTGHEGIDIQAPVGSRVFAVAPGRITRIVNVSENRPYGNAVYMEHAGGYRTAYAHLSQIAVQVGDEVPGGWTIGQAGETGNAQGPHLHLTLYKEGATARGETRQPRDIIDPTPFLNPLILAGWEPPQPPLISGWAWANSVQRHNELGRVSNSGGVNLRAEPLQQATRKGLVPRGTVVRVTGARRNSYYPVQVAQADLEDQAPTTGQPGTPLGYAFVNFENTAGDYTNVQPGRQFTVAWTLRNSGTITWTGDFRLTYVEASTPETQDHARARLGAEASYRLRDLTGREQVAPGESVRLPLPLVAPQHPGWYASHWQLQTEAGKPIGSPLWLRINVQGAAPGPKPETRFQLGMNINPDVHSLDVERLRGLQWVRFPYKAAAKHRSVDDAFRDEYRAVIQAYTSAGIKCLLILNQETEWGNGPWENGNWEAYAGGLGRAGGRIAELCAPFGDMVAYQIWNEEDSGPENPSAIGVAPENFAPVLGETAGAIRQVNPGATIIFGGLNTAPEHAVAYVRTVRERLGGSLPVDALAVHPYGRYVDHDPFYSEQFGTLAGGMRPFKEAFPNMPVWMTEMGVASDSPIGPEHYEKIARYMREIVTEVANNLVEQVPVLIWFAWSDMMRNAGIIKTDGTLKAHIGETFYEMMALTEDGGVKEISLEEAPEAEFVRFATSLADHNAVPAGSSFTNHWYFLNTGNTAWGEGYRLVYAPQSGNNAPEPHPMLDGQSFALAEVAAPAAAEPGQEVEIALTMTAPEQPGRNYRSRWELRDPEGKTFGSLYAEITVVPASPVGSGAQHADMAFVADHTIPDDTRFSEGETFRKQWRVRNTGARQWGDGFRLVFVEGDLAMARGVAAHMVPTARRNDEVILTVPMVAPIARDGQATTYQSLWRLQDDRGNFFGTSIWARIISLPSGLNATMGRFGDPAGWYSQLDARWQGDRLGHGQQTIGAWGCLLTCQAMMLTACGLPVAPPELNERLRTLGTNGFRGSDVQFVAPTHVLPGLTQGKNVRSWPDADIPWTQWTGENPIVRIDQALAAGHVVMAQVDRAPNNAYYHSNTEQHWVILVSRTPDGSDYLILDPMTPAGQLHNQPISLMRKYGNAAPSRPHEENLRHAIKSALIYRC